jgi:hypothetical protein
MWSYPVLDPVSQAYPRAEGRSPTCYSPVRRSCTPEEALPLDLHVLSTPPAFVLSQDQTLQQNPDKTNRRDGVATKTNWHKTNPLTHHPQRAVHKARHTVEFSKDTRTPCDPCGSGRGNSPRLHGPERPVKLVWPVRDSTAPCRCGRFPGVRRESGPASNRTEPVVWWPPWRRGESYNIPRNGP